jgi:hypothetical protein
MRSLLAIIVGAALLAPLSARAETLTITCTTRGLPPGARVWIEVQPEYHELAVPTPDDTTVRDSRPPVVAEAKHAWQFEVSAGGDVTPASHDFTFPATVVWTSSDRGRGGVPPRAVPSIFLRTRFRIDTPEKPPRAGYGEVQEATLGMSIPPGATEMITRCMRLRAEGDRLAVEIAADCSDASFAKAPGDGRMRVRLNMRPPGS